MDAFGIWRRWTSRPWAAALLTLAFAAPFVSGTIGRFIRGRTFFSEYESIACAGERVAAGLSPYGADFACAGMQAQPFVYLPWVAEASAAIQGAIGGEAMRIGYVAFYLCACALIGWIVFLRRETPGRPLDRVPFLAFVTGSALTVGNIAIPLAAAIAWAALSVTARPLVFIVVVALGATIKPFQLVYLAVLPLALGGSLARRGIYSALGGAVGLGAFAAAHALSPADALTGWREAASRMALDVAPGEGFLAWAFAFGVAPDALVLAPIYAAFAGACMLAALRIAARAALGKEERVFLGLTVAALTTPRLMQIDLLLLGPGLVVLAAAAARQSPESGRIVGGLVIGGACAALLLGLVDLGDAALKVGLASAAAVAARARAAASAQRPRAEPAVQAMAAAVTTAVVAAIPRPTRSSARSAWRSRRAG